MYLGGFRRGKVKGTFSTFARFPLSSHTHTAPNHSARDSASESDVLKVGKQETPLIPCERLVAQWIRSCLEGKGGTRVRALEGCSPSSPPHSPRRLMDLQFDNYTSYSDASTPRTPSPRGSIDDHLRPAPPFHYKPQVDIAIHRNIFDHQSDDTVIPESHALEAAQMWSNQYGYPQPPGSRGSLLEELYEHDIPEQNMTHEIYPNDAAYHGGNWSHIPQSAHGDHHIHPPPMRHTHDIAMTRRATFPYVRHDRADMIPYPNQPFISEADSLNSSPYSSRPGTMYGEPLSMDGSPHMPLSHHLDEPFAHTVTMGYDHLDGIKTEDSAPVIVPSQTAFCRPPSAGMHPLPCLSPHAGLLVQHTDDAASKETQYLRRRCFNCHTTEPPSWRRSTLNPGKIVCNKCGLYERTHLRPRPLRFDELRAGSKTRKQPKVGGSPKSSAKMAQIVKKEPQGEEAPLMQRRSSVSSASSVHSGGATSDWDDSGSAPPSSFNSPAVSPFSIPRDPNSQSPPLPRDGGIRLPNTPLSDIASLQSQESQSPTMNSLSPPTPRKAATAPSAYFVDQQQQQSSEMFARRGSLPLDAQRQQQQAVDIPIPEVTGWQNVPMTDLAPAEKPLVKSRSNSLRKPVAA
ncbi:GATA-type domain-containing protein [Abortiporus biennis]